MSDIRGLKGEQGPDGEQGRDGPQGIRGSRGRDGEPGIAGVIPATSESRTDCNLTLDLEYLIVDVSSAYAAATLSTRDGLIGRYLFEAFKDNPGDPDADGVKNLRASLERVKESGEPDAMPVQRYDIIRPVELGNGYEIRFWKVINSPIFREGEMVAIVHHVEDRTQTEINQRQLAEQANRITTWLIRGAILMAFVIVGLIVAVAASNSLAHRLADNIQVQRVHGSEILCKTLFPAIHQYPIDAATARERSARLELIRGPHYNPVQAQIDLAAARAFRADAGTTTPEQCAKLIPVVR